MTIRVEICVEDVAGVRAAERGGAQRIELCAGLGEGGTTPSLGTMEAARAATRLPLVALIRPRPGDFVYDEDELGVMRRDVRAALELGFEGVALGVLGPGEEIDVERTAELVELAGSMDVVFHRAFDQVREASRALEELTSLRVRRILTSGQAPTAALGAETLHELSSQAAGRIGLVAAGGVRAHNVAELVRASGVREVHASAFGAAQDPDPTRVPLGTAAGGGHLRRRTDEAVVRELVRAAAGR